MTSSQSTRPYVVSGDIEMLLTAWEAKSNFIAPSYDFVKRLRDQFSGFMSTIFSEFIMIYEDELMKKTQVMMGDNTLPVINLDGIFNNSRHRFELCRANDSDFVDVGILNRAGSLSIAAQLQSLRDHVRGDAVLFDDVIFSGKLVSDFVIPTLQKAGIRIRGAYACVGIGEGISRVAQHTDFVKSAFEYDHVVDQVCERDFYLGVPFSGRQLSASANIGMPYIAPFGNPQQWASIPEERVREFSQFCTRQTIALFEEIEHCSNRIVQCRDIPRKVRLLPVGSERFVDELRKYL